MHGGVVEPLDRLAELHRLGVAFELPRATGSSSAALAASFADSPVASRSRMRRTRLTSAGEYSRYPASVRVGDSSP